MNDGSQPSQVIKTPDPDGEGVAPDYPCRVWDLLWSVSQKQPDAIALEAPDRQPLTFGLLQKQVDSTVRTLNGLGTGPGDTVAFVVENGPEMAALFVALAAGATAAPLNPAYQRSELEFYLSDLASFTSQFTLFQA
jgi:acyl-CoA synthetase (AMP-forming)/AMP-acid ligase II